MFRNLMFLILFCLPIISFSQVLPKEGSQLHYRIIGFSFQDDGSSRKYNLEIAAGNHKCDDSFAAHIIHTATAKTNRIIAEVPAFGADYTWRVVYGDKHKSRLYHFSTRTNDRIDTNKLRIRIMQPAARHQTDYVIVDAGGVLYDMTGKPVWYLPDTPGISGYVIDIKFTPQGTITFLSKNGYEMNYNGEIIWKTPETKTNLVSNDTVLGEFYHHEFTKLANGHYMALGMEVLMCKSVTTKDSTYVITYKDQERKEQNGFVIGKFGTLIEYDEHGKRVWSWKSADHITGPDADFAYYVANVDSLKRFDPHENAFFFDEKNKCVYLGARNLNRITRIDYPSGKISAIYGERFKPGMAAAGSGLFCNQHNINRSANGDLYLFDNNSCMNRDSMPTIIMFKEPADKNAQANKTWEYKCNTEKGAPKIYASGGNVYEMPDGGMFVNMGSEYSKMFILGKDRKEYWSAVSERFMETDQKWTPIREYRANIISRADLEKMIWAAEDKK